MAMFSSFANTCGLSATLLPIIGTIDIDSVPPASIRSAWPMRIWSAASATACRPDEQKRLMVCAANVCGRPASSTPMRATFMPCSPSGMAQPMIASSMRLTSMPGACATTLLSTCASMSSGRVLRNTPRGALPTGVRVAATMYASCICLVMESVPERLAGLQHVRDAFLGLGHLREGDEVFALQAQQPVLIDERAAVHFASAQHRGDARGDLVVVRRDETAFEHVDQQHLKRRDAHVARDLDAAGGQGRAVAGLGQRPGLRTCDVQQFEGVEHDEVVLARELELLRFECGGGHLAHRHAFERGLELREHIAAGTG